MFLVIISVSDSRCEPYFAVEEFTKQSDAEAYARQVIRTHGNQVVGASVIEGSAYLQPLHGLEFNA